jgi:peptidoglycan/LPS O-acetylase OafA/YrhL
MSQPPGGHRPQLDSVRFFAFLGVFLFHAYGDGIAYGGLGVRLFFVLSGFLITRILEMHESGALGSDLLVFYTRRTLRIFPLYYAVLLVLWLSGNLPSAEWYFLYLHNIYLFVNGVWTGQTSHFWTLCVEEQFYLIYPLLLLTTPSRRRGLLLVLLLLGSVATRLALDATPYAGRSWALLPVSGEYLLWGCLAGLIDLRTASRPIPVTALFLAGALLHGLTALDAYRFRWLASLGAEGVYQTAHGIAFAVVIFSLWRMPQNFLIRMLSFEPLVYLGKISYGLYVFHNFTYGVQGLLVEVFPAARALSSTGLALLTTIALSMLSWHLFEGPINRLKDRMPYLPDRPRREPLAVTPETVPACLSACE